MSSIDELNIDWRRDVEDSSGYTASFIRISELFHSITENKKVNHDGFMSVAKELSERVKADPTAVTIALINAIAPVSDFLLRHTLGVAMLNGLTGMWLGLSDERIDKLVLIGLLHDCGHALMPPSLLHSPRIYSKMDYEVIKMHTIRTEQLLIDFPDDVRITASAHHERIDGSGYPKGISGEAVAGAARITAISDIYEAIVTSRPYRQPQSPFHALDTLDTMAPSQVDNDVVNILKENLPNDLIDMPVTMSDGTLGIIRECDIHDIRYPIVEIDGEKIKTNDTFYCVSMYLK